MSTLPIYKLPIRHHYVLDADGHHPWRVGWPKSERVWYGDLTAEEIIEELHAIAATIWQQAGIDLEIEAIEPLDLPEWYRYPPTRLGHYTDDADVHGALVGSVWAQGQRFLNVIWVRSFRHDSIVGDVMGSTYSGGYYRSSSGGWYGWVPSYGIVVESSVGGGDELRGNDVSSMGGVLAHEVGHAMGLNHVFSDFINGIRTEERWMEFTLSPFVDDVSGLGDYRVQRNLMSYFDARGRHVEGLSTIPSDGIDLSEVSLTDSQCKRARLTLLRRMNVLQAVLANPDVEKTPNSFQELNSSREATGLTRLPILPDCVPREVLMALL